MERYGVTGGRTVMTPFPAGFKLKKAAEEDDVLEDEQRNEYQSLIGSVMYAAVHTQPDASFGVGQLARVVQRPTEEQLEVAKRLVCYLGSTASAGVRFSAGGQLKQIGADGVTPGTLKLSCFTDATWASEDEDQSSVGGFVCMVGGGPVSWRSKKQSEIAQSSGEAEYMAMYHAIKEIVLLRKLLEDMGAEQEGPTPLFSVRPRRPSSFVSGTLGVGGLGVLFPDAVELPRWGDLLRQNVAIFDLHFDAILAAMYALTDSAEGDCYLSVPPDPGIEAAALGASASAAPGTGESAAPGAGESALSGTAPTEALHTFTLDFGASRSFFRDSTTLPPLSRPVAVSLADPSGGPVLAHSSTVLPCPADLSGLLSGLHLPSFSTNLRVTHCTCSRTGHHLATFTRRPGSSLYTLTTASPPITASGQVAASSQVFAAASRSSPASAPCSCRPLSHETLLWHHHLGHPSLPRLRGMASRTLVSGLPRSLPPLPPGPAPTCVPCVEGRQCAAPHSSTFPPTEAPLQTLHMDVGGPARVRGQGHERYFLLVVDDYSRYTIVFPLRSKGEVPEVLIDWIRGARCQLSERFGSDLPILSLHSDIGGGFFSDLRRAFCRAEGIRQTFTLAASPQQNGIAERRIGMVMDVARTSMIHAAAPHFLWPFAVQYSAHQINRQPHVSLPETTPTLCWMHVILSACHPNVLPSARAICACMICMSVSFVRDTSADKLSSRADVTFDEVVCYYRLFPYRTASLPSSPLFLAPGTPPVDPLPPQGHAPSSVSQVDPAEPVEVAVNSGAARGAEPTGVGTGGAEPGGAKPERVEPGGAEPGGTASGGAEPARAESGGSPGVPLRQEPLSPQQLREWYARRCRRATGAAGAVGATRAAGGAAVARADGAAGGAAGAGAGAARGAAGAGAAGVASGAVGGPAGVGAAGAAGPGGARTGGTGADGAAGVVAGDPGLEGSGVVSAVSGGPASLLHGPSPYSGPARGLTERREPESRPVSPESRFASPVCTSASDSVFPPSVGGECALGTDVLEDRQEEFDCFAVAVPHLVSMLLAPEGDLDAPDIPTPHSYAEAIEGPYSSQWQAAMDAEMASWKSTSTYVDEFPPPRANIVSGMWIFRVKRPSDSPPVFKARYVARGFNQRQGVDFFQTFSPTPKMTTLWVLQRFGLTYSSPQSTPLLTGHSLSAPPSDESVEPSGPYPELVGCLMYLMTCTRPDLAYPLATWLPIDTERCTGMLRGGVALPVQYDGHGARA
ncbi:unnamed protein product [Closterium sp. NIES-54]